MPLLRTILRGLLALFFIAAGANHFISPEIYLGMMPPGLPAPDLLHRIAGAAEMAGGVGLFIPRLRRPVAWGLVALLVAIFPANLHVALAGSMPGLDVPPWVLWARLPFQAGFIAAVWWAGACRAASPAAPSSN